MSLIVHVADPDRWERARESGAYRHPTLDAEGFVHFSLPDQVTRVANSGGPPTDREWVLLCVDESRLDPAVRYEPGDPDSDEEFPHVYGPVGVDAVVEVLPFPVEDGAYVLPDGLEEVRARIDG